VSSHNGRPRDDIAVLVLRVADRPTTEQPA
jgi:hypothetical protein